MTDSVAKDAATTPASQTTDTTTQFDKKSGKGARGVWFIFLQR